MSELSQQGKLSPESLLSFLRENPEVETSHPPSRLPEMSHIAHMINTLVMKCRDLEQLLGETKRCPGNISPDQVEADLERNRNLLSRYKAMHAEALSAKHHA